MEYNQIMVSHSVDGEHEMMYPVSLSKGNPANRTFIGKCQNIN